MKNFIPKGKGDIAAVEHLNTLPFETVEMHIPRLLIYLQDLNWEVAGGIIEFLIPYVNEIKKELIPILNGIDDPWKSGILTLIEKSEKKIDPELLSNIKRIADHPTLNEKDEYLDAVAKRILNPAVRSL